MCRRITCSRCGKPTFAGCGGHIEQVLGDVPRAQRCCCGAKSAANESFKLPSWWPFGAKKGDK